MADIISLSEYRAAAGVDPSDTRDDAQITTLIPFVGDVVRAYTERDFAAPVVTETRTFDYDGSGYLDIDDASAITQVSLTYPPSWAVADIVLTTDEWTPRPTRRDDALFYTYIELPGYTGAVPGSPEMGFTRNLDVYARERGLWALPNFVKVTATWGYPVVPGDVKMAAVWIIQDWMSREEGEGLSSESIESFSRSWGGRGGAQTAAKAIPDRARDILSFYAKALA